MLEAWVKEYFDDMQCVLWPQYWDISDGKQRQDAETWVIGLIMAVLPEWALATILGGSIGEDINDSTNGQDTNI